MTREQKPGNYYKSTACSRSTRHVAVEAYDRNYRGRGGKKVRIMHEAFEFMQDCVGVEGHGASVCPYYAKECFCHSKKFTGLLCHLFFFSPSISILPHTFEPLCGIVPWSWLGSLLPRPLLPSWPAGSPPNHPTTTTTSPYPSTPPPPTIPYCQSFECSTTNGQD